jgi:hypothetical protein
MWQITWMIGLLPEWVWPALLILGSLAVLASFVLGFIPIIKNYKLPIQVGGILAVAVSVWFLGAASNEEKWQAKIKELEAQVKKAEEQSKETNVVVETKIVEKTKIIKEKAKTQIEYVDRVVTQDKEIIKYIEQCPVPKIIIDEHNKAATPPDVIKELNKAAEGKK